MNELMLASILTFSQPNVYQFGPVDFNYEEQAMRYASKALYKKYKVGKYIRRLEKRYVNKDLKKYGAYIGIGSKILIERRITLRLEF